MLFKTSWFGQHGNSLTTTWLIYYFQVKLLSIWIPKYLNECASESLFPFSFIFKSLWSYFLVGVKKHKLIVTSIKGNVFAFTLFAIYLVSSAKWFTLEYWMTGSNSFIQIRNETKEACIEPWSTQHFTSASFEL